MTHGAPHPPNETPPEPDPENPAAFPSPATGDTDHPKQQDGGASGTLWNLISFHPFKAQHDRWKDVPLDGWALVCFVLELIMVMVVVAALIWIAILIAWKSIAPLPPFHL